MNELDELEINYLKRSFGKQVVIENNPDSREIKDLIWVRAHVDGIYIYTYIRIPEQKNIMYQDLV